MTKSSNSDASKVVTKEGLSFLWLEGGKRQKKEFLKFYLGVIGLFALLLGLGLWQANAAGEGKSAQLGAEVKESSSVSVSPAPAPNFTIAEIIPSFHNSGLFTNWDNSGNNQELFDGEVSVNNRGLEIVKTPGAPSYVYRQQDEETGDFTELIIEKAQVNIFEQSYYLEEQAVQDSSITNVSRQTFDLNNRLGVQLSWKQSVEGDLGTQEISALALFFNVGDKNYIARLATTQGAILDSEVFSVVESLDIKENDE